MLSLFFVAPEVITSDEIALTGSQAHHAISVLRLQSGEVIRLADGVGNWVDGSIIKLGKDELSVQVRERGSEPIPQTQITVAQAILKGDNQKVALDQLVQAGVDSILPWQAQRSVATIDKSQKWREVIVAAARQSRRARIPDLLPKSEIRGVITASSEFDCVLALHESASSSLSSLSSQMEIASARRILIVVGPEGGLSDPEIEEFARAGIPAARLGTAVLRADLAGAIALGALHVLTKGW